VAQVRRKVLLVEDDESVRQLVRVTLQMNDFEVVEAKDGLEGLLLMEMHHPDAVVLDLMMPDVGGERMLAQLRAAPETKRIPVVIITGKPEVAPEVIGLVGRENFFPKPFDPDAVVSRLKAMVG
jgi:DNA-binding response OmpR family regulator